MGNFNKTDHFWIVHVNNVLEKIDLLSSVVRNRINLFDFVGCWTCFTTGALGFYTEYGMGAAQ